MQRQILLFVLLLAPGGCNEVAGRPDARGNGAGGDAAAVDGQVGEGGAIDRGGGEAVSCEPPKLPATVAGALPAGSVAGALRTHATQHSISVEWDLQGDDDHDATCKARFRRAGTCAWQDALPLFRINYAWYYDTEKAPSAQNLFAGSLLFLTPGTTYEVLLELGDPDGGSAGKLLTVATRAIPRLPSGGGSYHVVPGSGGGKGTSDDPFRGIAAAQAVAKPGDVFLLHKGTYASGTTLGKPGATGGKYVVWRAAGDGEARFDGLLVTASHVWVEGLTFAFASGGASTGIKVPGGSKVTGAVIAGNTFSGYNYSITLNDLAEDFTITDNTIVGDADPDVSDFGGEGVELNHSSGHVVAYNRISRVADGVSYALRDCDIYGNDIFDTSDDGIEPDYGFSNIRMWGNRIHNPHNNGISFQPMKLGPWYIIRNQVIGMKESVFKFRTLDRFLVAHNTFVNWGNVVQHAEAMMFSFSRNNLFVSAGGSAPVWSASNSYSGNPTYYNPPCWTADWRTDVDYDGFDWGGSTAAFSWNGKTCSDLTGLCTAAGIEKHGRRVERAQIFASYNIPASWATIAPMMLELRAGGAAEDAGAVVPNLNQGHFQGAAPDLGAYERGAALPHYGPRSAADLSKHESYWALY